MKATQKIVAIGGGEIKDRETLEIDKRIVELTGKTRPKALFIPTASGDAAGYIDTFAACYGKRLGCQTRTLSLTQTPPAFEEMSALVPGFRFDLCGGWKYLQNDENMAAVRAGYSVSSGCSSWYCSVGSQRGGDLLVQTWTQRFSLLFQQLRVELYPRQRIGFYQCCVLSALSF